MGFTGGKLELGRKDEGGRGKEVGFGVQGSGFSTGEDAVHTKAKRERGEQEPTQRASSVRTNPKREGDASCALPRSLADASGCDTQRDEKFAEVIGIRQHEATRKTRDAARVAIQKTPAAVGEQSEVPVCPKAQRERGSSCAVRGSLVDASGCDEVRGEKIAEQFGVQETQRTRKTRDAACVATPKTSSASTARRRTWRCVRPFAVHLRPPDWKPAAKIRWVVAAPRANYRLGDHHRAAVHCLATTGRELYRWRAATAMASDADSAQNQHTGEEQKIAQRANEKPSVLTTTASRERRAWDSNPQPLAGHLISSQTAGQFAYPPGTVQFNFLRKR